MKSKEKNKNILSIQDRIDKRLRGVDKINLWVVIRVYVDVAFFEKLFAKLIAIFYFIAAIFALLGITVFKLLSNYKTALLWIILVSVFLIILYIIIYPSVRFIKEYILIKKDYKKNNINCFKFNAYLYGLFIKKEELNYILKKGGSVELKNKLTIVPTTESLYSMEKRCKSLSLKSRKVGCYISTLDSSKAEISLDLIRDAQSEKIWKIKFVPSLDRNKNFTYIIHEKLPANTFAMTKKTLPKYLKYEYISKQVRYPTELLVLELVFPKKFVPVDYDFDVWFGEGELRNRKEHIRIDTDEDRNAYFEDDKTDDGKVLVRLRVAYPILGLFYVIHWNPP